MKNLNYKINISNNNNNRLFNKYHFFIIIKKKFRNFRILDCKKLFCSVNTENFRCYKINNKIIFKTIKLKTKSNKLCKISHFFINIQKNNKNK